jgi:hypothetical protein
MNAVNRIDAFGYGCGAVPFSPNLSFTRHCLSKAGAWERGIRAFYLGKVEQMGVELMASGEKLGASLEGNAGLCVRSSHGRRGDQKEMDLGSMSDSIRLR